MRYFLQLAYRGTNYHGWQIQPNAISVQEVLDKALSTLCGEPVFSLGCGRTDAGVHARDFYAHFDTQKVLSQQLIINLNGILPKDISAKRFIEVAPEAHARFDASARSYQYLMHFNKDPFKEELSYYFNFQRKPDYLLMNEGAKIIMEYDDFACFSKANTDVFTTICKLTEAKWELQTDGSLVFHITANRFLRNMVRAIVGTLIDYGIGKINEQELRQIILNKNRSLAGTSVPANGLYLTNIKYPYINE
jgi:tRNA pseudouridine38-40 synthase